MGTLELFSRAAMTTSLKNPNSVQDGVQGWAEMFKQFEEVDAGQENDK